MGAFRAILVAEAPTLTQGQGPSIRVMTKRIEDILMAAEEDRGHPHGSGA